MTNNPSAILFAVCLLALSALPAAGQGYGGATMEQSPFPVLKPQRKSPAPPPVSLVLVQEVPIPGPLAGSAMEVDGNSVRVPVHGGYVLVDLSARGEPVVTLVQAETAEPGEDGGWILAGKKQRYRFRTEPEGRIVAQKRPSSRSSAWRGCWDLKTPGSTPAPPLMVGKMLLFGCSDNRVYALKARNGHRLWHQDLEHRILFPLVHWRGRIEGEEYDLVLVVPHPGRSIRVLDPFDGKSLARFRLGQGNTQNTEDEVASHPAILADGLIVLPVQKYRSEEAVLQLLRLDRQVGKADKKDVNGL